MPVDLNRHTPQSEPARGDQTQNAAGGYAWALDKWARLDRFLILGIEGGTLYASQGELTRDNTRNLSDCIAESGERVVLRAAHVSDAGLAHKNDYALYALAAVMAEGQPTERTMAGAYLPKVARTASHLFAFVHYVTQMRGWGRALREAVAGWYNGRSAGELEYQLVKYQGRAGWTHRDVLRQAHPAPVDAAHDALYAWAVRGADPGPDFVLIQAMRQAHEVPTERVHKVLAASRRLPREALPTEALRNQNVWLQMLENGMPMTAMIRNLATMTRLGVVAPMSKATVRVAETITDRDRLAKARIHPIQLLAALATYRSGHGARGRGEWDPVQRIVDALDVGFHRSFANVEPTGKRIMLALDVSGSMTWAGIGGVPGLTAREGATALALVTAAVEPNHVLTAFSGGMVPLDITARDSLSDAMRKTDRLPFSRTDCAQPMIFARERGIPVDAFVVLTDSETWSGAVHPFEALRQYRQAWGIDAKLIVVGMTSGGFTIADPRDPNMLDVVGFDPSTPLAINRFIAD